MNYNWDWGILIESPYLDWILSGLAWTLLVASAAWVIAFMVGSIVGILRTVENRVLRTLATAYVELFRGIPLLVQLFLWFYVFPIVAPGPIGNWLDRKSTRLNSSHVSSSYAVFCLKKKSNWRFYGTYEQRAICFVRDVVRSVCCCC